MFWFSQRVLVMIRHLLSTLPDQLQNRISEMFNNSIYTLIIIRCILCFYCDRSTLHKHSLNISEAFPQYLMESCQRYGYTRPHLAISPPTGYRIQPEICQGEGKQTCLKVKAKSSEGKRRAPLTDSGIGTSSWVPEGARIASRVSPRGRKVSERERRRHINVNKLKV